MLIGVGRIRPEFGRSLPKFERCRAKVGRLGSTVQHTAPPAPDTRAPPCRRCAKLLRASGRPRERSASSSHKAPPRLVTAAPTNAHEHTCTPDAPQHAERGGPRTMLLFRRRLSRMWGPRCAQRKGMAVGQVGVYLAIVSSRWPNSAEHRWNSAREVRRCREKFGRFRPGLHQSRSSLARLRPRSDRVRPMSGRVWQMLGDVDRVRPTVVQFRAVF